MYTHLWQTKLCLKVYFDFTVVLMSSADRSTKFSLLILTCNNHIIIIIVCSKIDKKTNNRAKKEKFCKQRNTFLKKVNEFRLLCKADIYIVLRHNNKYYTYTSTDQSSWPSSSEQIVSFLVFLHSTLSVDHCKESELSLVRSKNICTF